MFYLRKDNTLTNEMQEIYKILANLKLSNENFPEYLTL